jgi:hypothetical protein
LRDGAKAILNYGGSNFQPWRDFLRRREMATLKGAEPQTRQNGCRFMDYLTFSRIDGDAFIVFRSLHSPEKSSENFNQNGPV